MDNTDFSLNVEGQKELCVEIFTINVNEKHAFSSDRQNDKHGPFMPVFRHVYVFKWVLLKPTQVGRIWLRNGRL